MIPGDLPATVYAAVEVLGKAGVISIEDFLKTREEYRHKFFTDTALMGPSLALANDRLREVDRKLKGK